MAEFVLGICYYIDLTIAWALVFNTLVDLCFHIYLRNLGWRLERGTTKVTMDDALHLERWAKGIVLARETLIRYLTIPYLVLVPGGIVYVMTMWEDPLWYRIFGVVGLVGYGAYLWDQFKNRKNKKKRGARVLARVAEKAGKLVVVAVPVKVEAR